MRFRKERHGKPGRFSGCRACNGGGFALEKAAYSSLNPERITMADFLVFEGVSKSYGDIRAVDSVSLSINKGEIFSLLGPSGCGKTTLLRCCAGFEDPDAGRIILDGRDITGLPPHERKVNTVFQNYALFPHLTIRDNIAFGPRMARWTKGEIDKEIDRMLELIQMEDYADRKVTEINGMSDREV
jgi:spermidine/putrescine transport system ATP-binding protein